MKAMTSRKEKGFTLIELVMVIVILGILAAFALPRFADFSGDAEQASIDAARGSLKSAMGITRAKALASNDSTTTGNASFTLEGQTVTLENGYLDATSIETIAQLGDYDVTVDSENAAVALGDPADGSPCFVFTGSTGANSAPSVSDVRNTFSSSGSGVAKCPAPTTP